MHHFEPSRDPSLLHVRQWLAGRINSRFVVFAAQPERPSHCPAEIAKIMQQRLSAVCEECDLIETDHGLVIGYYRSSGDNESILMAAAGHLWRSRGCEIYCSYARPEDYEQRLELLLLDDLILSVQASALMRYTRPLPCTIFRRRRSIQMFRDAVSFGWIDPHLQPIAHAETLDVVGWEMLARIAHSSTEVDASTGHWIPYVLNGHDSYALLSEVLARAAALVPAIDNAYLSINLTGKDMANPDLVPDLLCHKEYSSRLVLELTEWEDVLSIAGIRNKIAAIRDAGFRVALDDFGAMHSSVRVLREIRFDSIKLDMHLVRSNHPLDERIVRAVIDYCKGEGVCVTAEGIEEPWLLYRARALGADFVQGFFVDRCVDRPAPREMMLD